MGDRDTARDTIISLVVFFQVFIFSLSFWGLWGGLFPPHSSVAPEIQAEIHPLRHSRDLQSGIHVFKYCGFLAETFRSDKHGGVFFFVYSRSLLYLSGFFLGDLSPIVLNHSGSSEFERFSFSISPSLSGVVASLVFSYGVAIFFGRSLRVRHFVYVAIPSF